MILLQLQSCGVQQLPKHCPYAAPMLTHLVLCQVTNLPK
jgi:hypothetical protein